MGILLGALLGVGDVHHLQVLDGFLLGLSSGQLPVVPDRFHDLFAHRLGGVQAGHGILEDHGDFLASQGLHFLFAGLDDVMIAQMHLALGDAGRGHGVQLHHGLGGHALAATGFAHDGQHFALMEGKGDTTHGFHFAGISVEGHMQVIYVQNYFFQILCHGGHLLKRGSKASRRPSPNRLKESMVKLMAIAGIQS